MRNQVAICMSPRITCDNLTIFPFSEQETVWKGAAARTGLRGPHESPRRTNPAKEQKMRQSSEISQRTLVYRPYSGFDPIECWCVLSWWWHTFRVDEIIAFSLPPRAANLGTRTHEKLDDSTKIATDQRRSDRPKSISQFRWEIKYTVNPLYLPKYMVK